MSYDPFGNIINPTTGKRRRAPRFKESQGYTREFFWHGGKIMNRAMVFYNENKGYIFSSYAKARKLGFLVVINPVITAEANETKDEVLKKLKWHMKFLKIIQKQIMI